MALFDNGAQMLHSVVGIHCAPGTLGWYQPLMLGLVS